MSGSDQHVMRINLRRMELSAFIELLSRHPIKRRRPGPPGRRHGGKAVPSSVPLFDGKPLVACIESRMFRQNNRHRPRCGRKSRSRFEKSKSIPAASNPSKRCLTNREIVTPSDRWLTLMWRRPCPYRSTLHVETTTFTCTSYVLQSAIRCTPTICRPWQSRCQGSSKTSSLSSLRSKFVTEDRARDRSRLCGPSWRRW
jgi:hypothetical protein